MKPDLLTDHYKHNGTKKNNVLRDKQFIERNSLIDDLMESNHIKTIYRMSLSILVGLILHTAAYEYVYKGQINFGQKLIISCLEKYKNIFGLWLFMFACNFVIYYSFRYWAAVRNKFLPNSLRIKSWDAFWFGLLVAYYPLWLFFITKVTVNQKMSFFLNMIALTEIVRMLMKVHAFIRSNVPRALNFSSHQKSGSTVCPTFSQFMYFLWVPTLVYRDFYPRSKTIRWSYVAAKVVELVGAIFWISVFIERYIIANFEDFGVKPYKWSDIIVITIANAAAGLMLMVAGFYIMLHLWMGAFAEICRFADRMFYQDWWTSTNYERYYRTWNIVIHDWLYAYVYKDCYEHLFPGNKIAARVMVFFLSAVFHDYILAFAFGFYLPILFILFFICGTLMTFVKMKPDVFANTFFLYSVGFGCSISITAYSIEYYARQNCPIQDPTLFSYVMPKFLSCGLD